MGVADGVERSGLSIKRLMGQIARVGQETAMKHKVGLQQSISNYSQSFDCESKLLEAKTHIQNQGRSFGFDRLAPDGPWDRFEVDLGTGVTLNLVRAYLQNLGCDMQEY